MYASLASRVSHGIRIACTPFFVCSIRFSWVQRSLESRITWRAVNTDFGTLVM
jgi:hypothetical protein